jgi:hypothetical protein
LDLKNVAARGRVDAMALVFKILWTGIFHAPGNTATIQAIAGAFANQSVRVFADESHPWELRSDPKLVERTPRFVQTHHPVTA